MSNAYNSTRLTKSTLHHIFFLLLRDDMHESSDISIALDAVPLLNADD